MEACCQCHAQMVSLPRNCPQTDHRTTVPVEVHEHNARIESVEASNRIEGVTAPAERVVAIVNRNEAPHGRSEAEIAGYRDVLNTIHGSHPAVAVSVRAAAPGEAAFTPALVRQFHR